MAAAVGRDSVWRSIGLSVPVLVVASVLTHSYGFLLFHSLVELVTICVALGVFAVAWNSRDLSRNTYLLVLGVAYFFVGAVHIPHVLSYKGMGVFPGATSNLPTQLWIVARYLESVSLLAAPLLLRRRIHALGLFAVYGVVTAALVASVFVGVFPDCYVPGVGLTVFKKSSEYVVCVILGGAAALMFAKRREFAAPIVQHIIASLAFNIAAELAFTQYLSVYGAANATGHVLRLLSAYLIYRAVIVQGLRKPYEQISLDLEQSQEAELDAHRALRRQAIERAEDLVASNTLLQQEVAERKRMEAALRSSLELKLVAQRSSIDETMQFALEEAVRLTDSAMGFFHLVGEDQHSILLKTWSRNTLNYCSVPDLEHAYPLEDAGVWADALRERRPVIHNDYASLPHKRGLPEGHVPVVREVVVPVFERDLVVAMIGVGNRESDYDQFDVDQLSLLIENVWEFIWRAQAEEEVRQHRDRLEELVEERTGELTAANAQLREEVASRRRLSAAIEQAAEAIILMGLDGVIQYANPAFEVVLGHARETAVGRNLGAFISEEDGGDGYAQAWETIRGGKTWSGPLVGLREDGRRYEAEAAISPVVDAAGAIVSFVVAARDRTEEMQLEQQLRQAQKMEAVGTLAGGIAHDFNNLLTGILGNIELAQLETRSGSRAADLLQEAAGSARRAAELTSHLLAMSRQQEPKFGSADINDVVRRVVRFLERSIPETIAIEMALDDTIPTMRLDAGQVEQALLNMGINARDAMHTGGVLRFETGMREVDAQEAAGHPPAMAGRYVCVTVSDTGVGIAPDRLEHIFEPFFTTKDVGKGTGLGLAMAYGCAEAHKGWIAVSSTVGQGTTFHLYLPAGAVPVEVVVEGMATTLPRGAETVLLVDDTDSVLKVGRALLEDLGYAVVTARNGEEALAVFDAHAAEVALVVTDMVMPVAGGYEVLRAIQERSARVPVMAMSGYASGAKTEELCAAGFAAFVAKPFRMGELAHAVRDVLDGIAQPPASSHVRADS